MCSLIIDPYTVLLELNEAGTARYAGTLVPTGVALPYGIN